MKRKSLRAPRLIIFISRHIQAIRISINQLSISPLATLMTFAVIGIALALPFGLYTLLQNVQGISHNLHDSAQISLYLDSNTTQASVNNLNRILKTDNSIENVTYISPSEGLKEFQRNVGANNVLSGLKTNPLPSVLIIQPTTSAQNNLQIQQLLSRLKHLPNISNVQLDMHWLQRFNAILLLLHRALLAIMLLFALGVLLIIGNTIRLTTQHHRDEIYVIKLLGGSSRFIRRPFLYSGMLYGLTGSIIAWLLVDFSMAWLQAPVTRLATLYGSVFELHGLDVKTTLFLIVSGCLLGLIGSWLAVRQHIRNTV